MTLVVLWNRYSKQCRDRGVKFYSYRQFCENYAKWCEENKETLHFNAVIGQKMEVDFAGKTFQMVDHLTGEVMTIVVFVAVLPYSQYIRRAWFPPRSRSGSLSTTMLCSISAVFRLWWSATTASRPSSPTRTGSTRS